jgi:hypothetical protein
MRPRLYVVNSPLVKFFFHSVHINMESQLVLIYFVIFGIQPEQYATVLATFVLGLLGH